MGITTSDHGRQSISRILRVPIIRRFKEFVLFLNLSGVMDHRTLLKPYILCF